MKEKSFKSWSKFHRLGKLKYVLIILLIYIILGNVSEQIVNIISNHMIILTFREIIVPTIFWVLMGIYIRGKIMKKHMKIM